PLPRLHHRPRTGARRLGRRQPARRGDLRQLKALSASARSFPAHATSTSPTEIPDPSDAEPDESGTRPSSAPISVDLPAPFGPVTATRSAQFTCRFTGPRVKPANETTASRNAPAPVPDRGAAAIVIRSSPSLRGSSTASSRSSIRSVILIL